MAGLKCTPHGRRGHRRLEFRALRDGPSREETARRLQADTAVDVEPAGAMIRRIIGDDAVDLDLPAREVDDPILHIKRIRPGRSRMIRRDTNACRR